MARDLRLLLARHGQTAYNAEKRFQGSTDVELNESGRAQAAALARRLAGERLDAIYASPLARARQTAEEIAAHHDCPFETDERLGEMGFGEWEGLTYEEITKRNPFRLVWWEINKLKSSPPGGESLADFAARVQAALQDIERRHNEGTVLIVAHGGVLKMILCQLLKLSPKAYWQFELNPASLSEVTLYPPGGIVRVLNDVSHFKETAWAN